jgi:hypothetical protein
LDALQLLWNSLEDEEGDKPAGHLMSLPGGTKRKNSYCFPSLVYLASKHLEVDEHYEL